VIEERKKQAQRETKGREKGRVGKEERQVNLVLGKHEPFEPTEILAEINNDLNGDTVTDRMADAGFGSATRATADDVLTRLKSSKK